MQVREKKEIEIPSLTDIQRERKRIRRGAYYRQALRGTVSVLVVVAAVAVLIATLFLPILQISGDSMAPTLQHDDILVFVKSSNSFSKMSKLIPFKVICLSKLFVMLRNSINFLRSIINLLFFMENSAKPTVLQLLFRGLIPGTTLIKRFTVVNSKQVNYTCF